jgi:hypothetical protein
MVFFPSSRSKTQQTKNQKKSPRAPARSIEQLQILALAQGALGYNRLTYALQRRKRMRDSSPRSE